MENNRYYKTDLIEIVKRNVNFPITTKEVSGIIDTLITEMTNLLINGDEIVINNFGTLKCKLNKPRKAFNMREKKTIDVPPTWKVKFSAGKNLKEKVKNNNKKV